MNKINWFQNKIKTLLFFVLLLLPFLGQAKVEDWTDTDRVLYKTYLTLQGMDTLQTFNMINCRNDKTCSNVYEQNPLLGNNPNKKEVLAFKIGMNYVLYRYLDSISYHEDRRISLTLAVGISILIVNANSSNGLTFSLRF
tara:strand:+ start:303 stop:722 length:420 start_codon:yes stop_codon:yes gene_type:complete